MNFLSSSLLFPVLTSGPTFYLHVGRRPLGKDDDDDVAQANLPHG